MRFPAKAVWQFSSDGRYLKEYPSLHAAARKHETHPSKIIVSITKGSKCKGYHWQYANGKKPMHIPVRKYKIGRHVSVYYWVSTFDAKTNLTEEHRGSFITECVSLQEAADLMSVPRHSVRNCCEGRIKHKGKYTFRFTDTIPF